MELVVCKDDREVAHAVSDWCRDKLAESARSVFVPAGNTPRPLYDLWQETKPDYLNGVSLLQIDEVIKGNRTGIFADFFKQQLPSYGHQLIKIDQTDRQADLAILGLGLNGHVAFHEPGLPRHFFGGCVPLSSKTCETLQLRTPAWGVTYGVGAFFRCDAIAMIVTGKSKKDILQKFLERRGDFPAIWLRDHGDFTVFADQSSSNP